MLTVRTDIKSRSGFTQLKSGLFAYKMKAAAVVSFRSFLLFLILITIMRLGEAVPLKSNLKERDSNVGEYSP